jgi:hypothetical protein
MVFFAIGWFNFAGAVAILGLVYEMLIHVSTSADGKNQEKAPPDAAAKDNEDDVKRNI